jgi:hypothetical protein
VSHHGTAAAATEGPSATRRTLGPPPLRTRNLSSLRERGALTPGKRREEQAREVGGAWMPFPVASVNGRGGGTPTSPEWHGPGCAKVAPPETCCACGRKALSLLSRVLLQNHRHSSRTSAARLLGPASEIDLIFSSGRVDPLVGREEGEEERWGEETARPRRHRRNRGMARNSWRLCGLRT